jgi:hypothetical protein
MIIEHKHTPSFICVGPAQDIEHYAVNYLQQQLCPHRHAGQPVCRCSICNAITEHQSPSVTWIEPTGDYVLDDIKPIFATIHYALEKNSAHAFVLANAHLLSIACANRLLKVVEEPPAGYFFIFLTADQQALLPTIRSRSTIMYTAPHHTPAYTALLSCFLDTEKQNDPLNFDALLKAEPLSVGQTKLLVHQLALSINYNSYPNAEVVKDIIEKAQRNFPQSGGTIHYLRWLYMTLHAALYNHYER